MVWKRILTDASRETASDGERNVLYALETFMNGDGLCHPGIPTIAKAARRYDSVVRGHLRSVERIGWIQTLSNRGRGRTNVYTATVPECWLPEVRAIVAGHFSRGLWDELDALLRPKLVPPKTEGPSEQKTKGPVDKNLGATSLKPSVGTSKTNGANLGEDVEDGKEVGGERRAIKISTVGSAEGAAQMFGMPMEEWSHGLIGSETPHEEREYEIAKVSTFVERPARR